MTACATFTGARSAPPILPHSATTPPLRALRVAQLAARLNMTPVPALLKLCSEQDLSALPNERIGPETDKLLHAPRPSDGLRILADTGMLRRFPELDRLRHTPQDPLWHPEGDVWTHTCLTVDQAARLRPRGEPSKDSRILLLAALCHDLGKPETTVPSPDGRIRSPGHANAGIPPTRSLLARLCAPQPVIRAVCCLVRHHLAPVTYPAQRAGPHAYRRLARELNDAGATPALLTRLARADRLGRTTADALARNAPDCDTFLSNMRSHVTPASTKRAVLGRHLVARGMTPGRSFRPILDRCREIQEESGCTDPDTLLEKALA